jgi:hypothetical protein
MYGKPREPKKIFYFGERALIKKHLERLIRQGEVGMKSGGFYTL